MFDLQFTLKQKRVLCFAVRKCLLLVVAYEADSSCKIGIDQGNSLSIGASLFLEQGLKRLNCFGALFLI